MSGWQNDRRYIGIMYRFNFVVSGQKNAVIFFISTNSRDPIKRDKKDSMDVGQSTGYT